MVRRRVYYAGLADARRENVYTASDIAKSGESKRWLVLWGTREGDYHITETHARDADAARSYALKHFPEIAGVGDVMPGQKARFLGKKGRRVAGVLEQLPERWIQYDTWLTVEASKELARKLRASGEYAGVRLGNYLVDEGKRYSKVYVKPKESGALE